MRLLGAVSYTHLDVYKRQLPQRIRYSFYRGREWLRQTSLRKALVAYVILGLLAALAATMLTILLISHIIDTVTYQPVSYTHLA